MTVLAESHLSGTTPSPAQYRAELRRLLRRLDGLEDGLDREVAETLRQMQRDLQAALAEASEGTAALLRLSQEGLDDLTARVAARWGSAITDATGQAVTLGAEITVGPIDRAFGGQIRGITQSATTDLLGIVSGFSTDLVQGATLDLRRRIRGELSSVLAGARTPGDAARLIGRNLTSANHFSTVWGRARAITVTELGRVSALAGQKSQEDLTRALGQAGGFANAAKRWINAHLPGARPDHLQAEADYAETGRYGPIPIDATYMIGGFPALYPHDPALPASQSVNCFPADTLVTADGIEKAYRRWWDGDMIAVTSTAGRLTGTPNHPVLTLRGWVGLTNLTETDHLVGYRDRTEGICRSHPYPQDRPSRIDEIFRLAEQTSIRSGRVRGLAVDFHGDGSDANIDVVPTSGLLQNRNQPTADQLGGYLPFTAADILQRSLTGQGLSRQVGLPAVGSSESPIGRLGQTSSILRRETTHAEPVSWPLRPGDNPGSQESSPDGGPAHPVPLSEGVFGLPGEVTLHQVLDIDVVGYSGYVYNLQTIHGWYTANSLLVRNCHCVSVTVLPCGPFKLREAVNADGDACMIDPLSRPAPKTAETMIRAATLEVGDETTEGAIVKSVTVGPDGKLKVRFEQGFSMGFSPDERVRIRVPSVEPAPTEGAS